MSLKSAVKRVLFGPPGSRVHLIKRGLLKGLRFNVDSATKSMRLLGMDEREVAAATASFTTKAVTAFDIGANDGWYSLFFASHPNVQRVFAFEPETALGQSLRGNFALNDERLLNKVTLIPKMVGDHNDDQWCSIDEIARDIALPAVFKVDVDGGEMDVFRGAAQTLARDGCMIVLETHTPELERECQAFLENLGYKTRIIKPGWYRAILPEGRIIAHNQWMIASRDGV